MASKGLMVGIQPSLFGQDLTGKGSDLGKLTAKNSTSAEKFISSVWTFPGTGGDQLYRWYGTLPRQLVEQLMLLYAQPEDTSVLDPFMGTGTTLDVADQLGVRAFGVDANPLACLACEAKLFGMARLDKISTHVSAVTDGYNRTKRKTLIEDFIEKFDYTSKWFRPDTLASVLELLRLISQIEDVRIQRLMFVSAAQVIRDVASVDPRCTHHLVTKKKPFIDPIPLWRKLVEKNSMIAHSASVDASRIRVTQTSAFGAEIESFKANFVLIHPPYLGVIHYNLIHRLAIDLLGFINSTEKPQSLSKYNFDHLSLKAADMSTDNSERYARFVTQLAEKMYRIVHPGGRCVVIIGDQRHKGHLRHPFTDFILEFEKYGFSLEESFIWLLENNGGMHVLRRGHFIDHNYILVLHKIAS